MTQAKRAARRSRAKVEAVGLGLRYALAIVVCVNVWSFVHYMFAAHTLVRDSES